MERPVKILLTGASICAVLVLVSLIIDGGRHYWWETASWCVSVGFLEAGRQWFAVANQRRRDAEQHRP